MTVAATDADSSISDNNNVRFYYVGNEDPPSPDGAPRFAVSEGGQVSVIGKLDAETDPVVTFTIEARDSLPSDSAG